SGVGGAIAAEILGLVPHLLEKRDQFSLGLESAMIGRDGDFHESMVLLSGTAGPTGAKKESRQRSFFQSLFDERLQLSSQRLVEIQIAADGVVDVAIGIESDHFFGGGRNQCDDGLGVAA